ncbi:MAG: hypothetical protein K2L69_07470 [Muribaculaceae bacterium]|nr:hypothetical protein [Muribaculaceae bacterium]
MKISKISFAALTTAIAGCLWSCNQKTGESTVSETGFTVRDSLEMAIANQDSLLMLINDISSDMASIKVWSRYSATRPH